MGWVAYKFWRSVLMEDVVGGDTGPRRWEEYFGELSCKPTTEAKQDC